MSMRMITWTGIGTGQGMLHAVLNLVVAHDKILENMVRISQCSFNYYSKCFQALSSSKYLAIACRPLTGSCPPPQAHSLLV
jgi:hypothetical protein